MLRTLRSARHGAVAKGRFGTATNINVDTNALSRWLRWAKLALSHRGSGGVIAATLLPLAITVLEAVMAKMADAL
jgi:hypothetical protein